MAHKSNDHETLMTLFDEEGNTVFEDEVVDNQDMNTVFSDDEELILNEEASKHLEIGSTFVSKYKIKKVLGQGGLGIAYLAEEKSSHNQVVIKEFFPKKIVKRVDDSQVSLADNATENELKNYESMKQVFEEESRNLVTVNRTQHKNVVGFSFAEKNVNNTYYFAMPYSEGEELLTKLNRQKEDNKKLSQKEIMEIIQPVLKGLSHIHKYGIFHKDIKPANIFMRKDDEPMLIDFGGSVTSANLLTRAYAPIEQVNKQLKDYGPYTDIYATAVMMYEMVTGKLPPRSQDRAEAIAKGQADPYVSLANQNIKGFEKHFLKAIDHGLKYAYIDRPETAKLFLEELRGDLKRKRRNKIIFWTVLITTLSSLLIWVANDSLKNKTFELKLLKKVTDDMDIYIDGQPKEADRVSKNNGYPIYKLDARKEHIYEVRKAGFVTRAKSYNVSGGENEVIEKSIDFIPDSVELTVKVRSNKDEGDFKANIFVDDEDIGREHQKKLKFFYEKGLTQKFKIEAKAEGYLPSNVELLTYKELMKKEEITLVLTKKESSIKFIGPHGFNIKIDGQVQKDKNGTKYTIPCVINELSVGKHSVMLYSSEGIKHKMTIGGRQIDAVAKRYETIDFNINLEYGKTEKIDKKATELEEYKRAKEEKKLREEAVKRWKEIEKLDKQQQKIALETYIKDYPKSPKLKEARKVLNALKKEEKKEKKKGLNKEVLSTVKFPELVTVHGLKVGKTEVTYNELVRYLNSSKPSVEELKKYFYCSGKYIAKYINKELSDSGEYHYFVANEYMNYPVTYISWKGAKAYTQWLSSKGRGTYRLLTLEEWKQLSSIGFKMNDIDAYAVHSKNSLGLSPVKTKLPTSGGIYDIFGNVAEWSEDKSSEYERIILGGSFKSNKSLMNPNEYFWMNENRTKNADIGFRVIKVK